MCVGVGWGGGPDVRNKLQTHLPIGKKNLPHGGGSPLHGGVASKAIPHEREIFLDVKKSSPHVMENLPSWGRGGGLSK